jgi:hypothetical protein
MSDLDWQEAARRYEEMVRKRAEQDIELEARRLAANQAVIKRYDDLVRKFVAAVMASHEWPRLEAAMAQFASTPPLTITERCERALVETRVVEAGRVGWGFYILPARAVFYCATTGQWFWAVPGVDNLIGDYDGVWVMVTGYDDTLDFKMGYDKDGRGYGEPIAYKQYVDDVKGVIAEYLLQHRIPLPTD